jgi:non-ribosomal peptide synthetase component F
MISHRNALTFVNWGVDYFNPASEDVFANHAPLNFDLSVFDIYVSVAAGACTCLVPSTIASNPRALALWIADNRITFWYSVPQVWVTLMNYADLKADALPLLKHILFAGEVFQPEYLKKLMTQLPHAAYFNLYGPTETNVCTVYRVPDAGFAGDRPVPIGNACANTEIVVLNDRAEPVAIGEEGELFVRGSGVTPGYYKDSERTRAAFRKSPLDRHHGDMLYGTGDIVLRCDMENFTYVCRKDLDRKSTRLNSSHRLTSRMPSSA